MEKVEELRMRLRANLAEWCKIANDTQRAGLAFHAGVYVDPAGKWCFAEPTFAAPIPAPIPSALGEHTP